MTFNKTKSANKKNPYLIVSFLLCIFLALFLLYYFENTSLYHQLFLFGGLLFLILLLTASLSGLNLTNLFFIISFIPMFSWPSIELMESLSSADPIQQFKIGIRAVVFIYFILAVVKNPSMLKPLSKGTLKWFTIFTLYSFISVIYSPMKFFSFYCALELFSYLIMISVLVSKIKNEQDLKRILNIIYFSLAIIIISGWLSSFIFPNVGWLKTRGIYTRLGGSFISAGKIALSACIIFIALSSRMLQSKRIRKRKSIYIILGLLLFTIAATIVRQIYIATFAGTLVIVFLLRKKMNKRTYYLTTVLLIFVCIILLLFYKNITSLFIRGAPIENLMTLNQRTILWKISLLKVYTKSPIWGQGFYIGPGLHNLYNDFLDPEPYSAHNMYVQLLVSQGIIGLIIILIPFIITIKNSVHLAKIKNRIRKKNNNFVNIYVEICAILFIFVILSIVHDCIAARIGNVPIPVIFWIIAGGTSVLKKHYGNNKIAYENLNHS
jgi:O-antigen ligase